MMGRLLIFASASDDTMPGAKSAPMKIRKFWFRRWTEVGPAPKLMSATRDSGTEPPVANGTGRLRMVSRFWRDSFASITRIGIWRSDSENFALFWSMSPSVAIRIVWLSATVDTPSCDAKSVRGVIINSGRCKSAEMRGARNSGSVFICSTSVAAVWSSFLGSEPDSMTDTSRPEPPPPGPFA